MKKIEVTTKPHVGIKRTVEFGDVPVTHDQDIVLVNGRQVGYSPHKARQRLALIRALPAPVVEEIESQLSAKFQVTVSANQPIAVIDAELDIDELNEQKFSEDFPPSEDDGSESGTDKSGLGSEDS